MIEFELKLEATNGVNTEGLSFLSQKHVVDTYYDTKDYALLRSGNFLRNRNDKTIDFKLNIGDLSHTYCKETNFDYAGFGPSPALEQIFKTLNIDYNKSFKTFKQFLKANHLGVLAVIDKERKTYKLDNLTISLDTAKDIGTFLEVELDLDDKETFDKDELRLQLISQLKEHRVINDYKLVNIGYVELYLKKHNPEAFELGLFK